MQNEQPDKKDRFVYVLFGSTIVFVVAVLTCVLVWNLAHPEEVSDNVGKVATMREKASAADKEEAWSTTTIGPYTIQLKDKKVVDCVGAALQKTMDAAKDWKKSTDLTWLKKQADVINSKIQPVKDAVSAHEQRLAQEAQAAAVQSSYQTSYQTSSTANSLNASTYTNPVYTGNAPAYQPTQPADNGYTYTPSTTCGDGGWNLRAQCQATIDQGGLVEMPIFDGLGGSRLIAGHNSMGAGWIGQLQQGQSTPYGTVQQVWHNATPDTINNSGIGTYLQTCDQNGNPIIVKIG